jgi:hypothetical protein
MIAVLIKIPIYTIVKCFPTARGGNIGNIVYNFSNIPLIKAFIATSHIVIVRLELLDDEDSFNRVVKIIFLGDIWYIIQNLSSLHF